MVTLRWRDVFGGHGAPTTIHVMSAAPQETYKTNTECGSPRDSKSRKRGRSLVVNTRIFLLFMISVAIVVSSVVTWHLSLTTTNDAFNDMSDVLRHEVMASSASKTKDYLDLLIVGSLSTFKCIEVTPDFSRTSLSTNILACLWNTAVAFTESTAVYMVTDEGLMSAYRRFGPERAILNATLAVGIPAPPDDPYASIYAYVPDPRTGVPLTDGPRAKVCELGKCPAIMDPQEYISPLPPMKSHPLWLAGQMLAHGQTNLKVTMALSGIWEPTMYLVVPFRDPVTNTVQAVLTISYQAARIKRYLQGLGVMAEMGGVMFIAAGPELHILSSTHGAVAIPPPPGAVQALPLPATASNDEIVQFVSRHINETYGNETLQHHLEMHAHIPGHGHYYINSEPLTYNGLTLVTFLAVPVKSFRGGIDESGSTSLKWTAGIVVLIFIVGVTSILCSTFFMSRAMRFITRQNEMLVQQLRLLTDSEINEDWNHLDMGTASEKLHTLIASLRPGQALTSAQVATMRELMAGVAPEDMHMPLFLRTMQEKKKMTQGLDRETGSWLASLTNAGNSMRRRLRSSKDFAMATTLEGEDPDSSDASRDGDARRTLSGTDPGSPPCDEAVMCQLGLLQATAARMSAYMSPMAAGISPHEICDVDEEEGDVEDGHLGTVGSRVAAHDEVIESLSKLGSLELDTLTLARVTDDRPILFVGYVALDCAGLLNEFSIPRNKLVRYLTTLESGMRPDALYHSAAHIADVTGCLFHLLTESGMGEYLRHVDVLAAICAGLVHDYKHPGVNNDFVQRTGGELAICYNDYSILENYHLAEAFRALQDPGCNFLKHLGSSVYADIRRIIIEMVLATDLKRHFMLLDTFRTRLMSLQDKPWDRDNESDRLLLLRMAIKVADLGHTCKPLPLHQQWTALIVEEFYLQGDAERAQHLDVSPFMDRKANCVPKAQHGFFHFVVLPLVEAWVKAFPKSAPLLANLMSNSEFWKNEQKKLRTEEHVA
eukprot:jgi/Mesvir1/24657/Mv21958-RA.2